MLKPTKNLARRGLLIVSIAIGVHLAMAPPARADCQEREILDESSGVRQRLTIHCIGTADGKERLSISGYYENGELDHQLMLIGIAKRIPPEIENVLYKIRFGANPPHHGEAQVHRSRRLVGFEITPKMIEELDSSALLFYQLTWDGDFIISAFNTTELADLYSKQDW